MVPSKTMEILASEAPNARIGDPTSYYVISGVDLNDLKALQLRFCKAPFDDANEKRDWENRLHIICSSAMEFDKIR